MKIILNNREEEFDKDQVTVSEMLELKKFTFRMRIVRINGKFIAKEDYSETIIHSGDEVQMIYLMSGG
jgi:sulfur carrier protein